MVTHTTDITSRKVDFIAVLTTENLKLYIIVTYSFKFGKNVLYQLVILRPQLLQNVKHGLRDDECAQVRTV